MTTSETDAREAFPQVKGRIRLWWGEPGARFELATFALQD
jgi:hypothetical protein